MCEFIVFRIFSSFLKDFGWSDQRPSEYGQGGGTSGNESVIPNRTPALNDLYRLVPVCFTAETYERYECVSLLYRKYKLIVICLQLNPFASLYVHPCRMFLEPVNAIIENVVYPVSYVDGGT